jgi:predicted DCC family thiol-disulfide oxidoreductase YuxK
MEQSEHKSPMVRADNDPAAPASSLEGEPTQKSPNALTVFFDGACPLCSREIATYRRQRGADSMAWIDVSRCSLDELGEDLDRDAALARLHVRRADGMLVGGAAAFAAVWQQLPAFAWVGRLASRPLVLPLLDAAYAGFLRLRRLWRTPGARSERA